MVQARFARPTWTTAVISLCLAVSIPASLASADCAVMRFGCPDLDCSGVVDGFDLGRLLGRWGGCYQADLDSSGVVDGNDLAILLAAWGSSGCPRPLELAGRVLDSHPSFEYVQTFNAGSDVTIGMDTIRLAYLVNLIGALYVTDRNPSWSLGTPLVDVRGASQEIAFFAGGIPANVITIDGSAALSAVDGDGFGRSYDLVIDMNHNGVFDSCDLIDGYGSTAGFTIIPDLTQGGPYEVTQHARDYPITGPDADFQTQRLWYPTDIASMTARPIAVISHGQGHDYRWYDELGTFLASWGFVTISHQNETGPGIETASTTTLLHTAGLINEQAMIADGVLDGHLDAETIVWIGHGRGGEGITRAVDRLFDGEAFTPRLPFASDDIKLLITIAPTDLLGHGEVGSGSDPHGVPFFLIYGSADGEVCGCPGDDASNSFNLFERAEGEHWSTYIHGADHNDFNCCGVDDFIGPPETALGRAAVQDIMKVRTLVAIKSTLDRHPAALELRWRRYESLRPLGVVEQAIVRNDESRLGPETIRVIDDFQTEPSLFMSSSEGEVTITVSNPEEGLSDDSDDSFTSMPRDPFNGHTRVGSGDTQRAVVFDWSGPASVQWTVVEGPADFSDAHSFGVRVAQGTRHSLGTAEPASFTVTLVDDDGIASSLSIGAYQQGLGQTYQRTGFGEGAGWQNEMQLVRLPLDDFRRHGSSKVNLKKIVAIRLDFCVEGDSATGRIIVDDLSLLAK